MFLFPRPQHTLSTFGSCLLEFNSEKYDAFFWPVLIVLVFAFLGDHRQGIHFRERKMDYYRGVWREEEHYWRS